METPGFCAIHSKNLPFFTHLVQNGAGLEKFKVKDELEKLLALAVEKSLGDFVSPLLENFTFCTSTLNQNLMEALKLPSREVV